MVQCTVVRCTTLVLSLIVIINGFSVERTFPSARILVHVFKRRATHWEPWQINRRICPPSLCRSSDSGGEDYRPRGTAGTVFFQGDIVLNKDDEPYIYKEEEEEKKPTRKKRATMRLRKKIWKNGEVPYEIDSTISPLARRYILRAFKHIQEKTCIRFKKKESNDSDYIRYVSEPGCWSNVGKRGGLQLISLGRGCEHLGTAVHETSHALGIWHEQARQDRDKYVKIVKENISPKYLPDFELISRRISTSRGYPYDYNSVMHYSKWAFTKAGDPTIKVIGIGAKLGLKIGQRLGLSTIDMAQLRDMYHCNQKEDSRMTTCSKGWVKHGSRCYKFYKKTSLQFSAANKECEQQHGHLLAINSKGEDKFIQKYIKRKYKTARKWRLGGKLINGSMMWFTGDKSRPKAMKYTNWDRGMPASYTTAVIGKSRVSKGFKWQGVWAGSQNQLPDHTYPFVCEKHAKRKCVKNLHKDGRDYRGKLDYTVNGITCQSWNEQYPHQHKLQTNNTNDGEHPDGLGNHNSCRNPAALRKKRPWCYTTKKNKRWQYCDVTACKNGGKRIKKKKPKSRQILQKQTIQRQTIPKRNKNSKDSGKVKNKHRKREIKRPVNKNVVKRNKSQTSKRKKTKRTTMNKKSSKINLKENSKRNLKGSPKPNTRVSLKTDKGKTSKYNKNNTLGQNAKRSSKTNTQKSKTNKRHVESLKPNARGNSKTNAKGSIKTNRRGRSKTNSRSSKTNAKRHKSPNSKTPSSSKASKSRKHINNQFRTNKNKRGKGS